MQITVLTAVRPETGAVLRGLSAARRVRDTAGPAWRGRAGAAEVRVLQAGVGFARAAAAVSRLDPRPDVLVSAGFAGALRADVDVGTLVVSAQVLWEEGSDRGAYEVPPALVAALAAAAGDAVLEGPLLSSPEVLASAAAKAAAGARLGAVAVEMEAAAYARYAVQHGLPFLPVRTVLDPMELSLAALPDELATSWTARARLVVAPALWPTIRRLRAHAVLAADVLAGVSARLLPRLAKVG